MPLMNLQRAELSFMIAHRTWTIADADNISCALKVDRASANGTHDELMESSSIYAGCGR